MSRQLPPEARRAAVLLYKKSLKYLLDFKANRDSVVEDLIPKLREAFYTWPKASQDLSCKKLLPSLKDQVFVTKEDKNDRDMTVAEVTQHIANWSERIDRVYLANALKYVAPDNVLGNVHERYPEDFPYARAFHHYFPDEDVHIPMSPIMIATDYVTFDDHGHHHEAPSNEEISKEVARLVEKINADEFRKRRWESFLKSVDYQVNIVDLKEYAGEPFKQESHGHGHH